MARVRALLTAADLPPRFERWSTTLRPGGERASRPGEWSGALVLVERGALEVECTGGVRRTFTAGALLALGCLQLRRLRNPGRVPTRLVAIRRRGSRAAARVGSGQ